jgi:hypothetical protein
MKKLIVFYLVPFVASIIFIKFIQKDEIYILTDYLLFFSEVLFMMGVSYLLAFALKFTIKQFGKKPPKDFFILIWASWILLAMLVKFYV